MPVTMGKITVRPLSCCVEGCMNKRIGLVKFRYFVTYVNECHRHNNRPDITREGICQGEGFMTTNDWSGNIIEFANGSTIHAVSSDCDDPIRGSDET